MTPVPHMYTEHRLLCPPMVSSPGVRGDGSAAEDLIGGAERARKSSIASWRRGRLWRVQYGHRPSLALRIPTLMRCPVACGHRVCVWVQVAVGPAAVRRDGHRARHLPQPPQVSTSHHITSRRHHHVDPPVDSLLPACLLACCFIWPQPRGEGLGSEPLRRPHGQGQGRPRPPPTRPPRTRNRH